VSVCLFCVREFVPGVNTTGKFCSFQCFVGYEKIGRHCTVGRMGKYKSRTKAYERKYVVKGNVVRKNLGKVLSELDINVRSPKERSKIFVSDLTPRGKELMKEALELKLKCLKIQAGVV